MTRKVIKEDGLPPVSSERCLEIVKALRDIGPMTMQDLASETKTTPRNVSRALVALRDSKSGFGKRVYIKNWTYYQEGQGKRYPRAIYALGNKPDEYRRVPNDPPVVRQKRYRIKIANIATSVFDFGVVNITKAAKKKAINAITGKLKKGF